jgi:hypothetical protein
MSITITDIKVVGLCSKHRGKEEPQKDIHGRVYRDDEICCIACDIEKGR